jgi:hypothetical protein
MSKISDAFKFNQAAIDKAERYESWCRSHRYDHRKFSKLADQAMEYNDFRILEMVYVRDEFETRQRSEGDELNG